MKKIAVSRANFAEIIKQNFIYVDKTNFIDKIASKDKYYFLSRPRRFGKIQVLVPVDEIPELE